MCMEVRCLLNWAPLYFLRQSLTELVAHIGRAGRPASPWDPPVSSLGLTFVLLCVLIIEHFVLIFTQFWVLHFLFQLEAFHRDFGFAFSDILVVSNYASEWHLDPVKGRLILLALRHILYTANDFLEDLPLDEQVSWWSQKLAYSCLGLLSTW